MKYALLLRFVLISIFLALFAGAVSADNVAASTMEMLHPADMKNETQINKKLGP